LHINLLSNKYPFLTTKNYDKIESLLLRVQYELPYRGDCPVFLVSVDKTLNSLEEKLDRKDTEYIGPGL